MAVAHMARESARPADTAEKQVSLAEPSHEEISKLAHSYWLQRRPEEGTAEDDWFRAETELRQVLAAGASKLDQTAD